jgi:hypothetical protein
MTRPHGQHHIGARQSTDSAADHRSIDGLRAIDPLTDSAVHRLALGTLVRLYLHDGSHVDVGLTAIRAVSTWNDLAARIALAQPIDVIAGRRRIFGGGVVLWAENMADPADERDPRDAP